MCRRQDTVEASTLLLLLPLLLLLLQSALKCWAEAPARDACLAMRWQNIDSNLSNAEGSVATLQLNLLVLIGIGIERMLCCVFSVPDQNSRVTKENTTRTQLYLECFSFDWNAPVIILLISCSCCAVACPLWLLLLLLLLMLLLGHLGFPHTHTQTQISMGRCARTNLVVPRIVGLWPRQPLTLSSWTKASLALLLLSDF